MTCLVPLSEENTVRVLGLVFGLKNDKKAVNIIIDSVIRVGLGEVEGVVCGTYGRKHKMRYSVLVGSPEGIDCSNGWTTLKWIAQM